MPVSAALVEFLVGEGLSGEKLITAIKLAEGCKAASPGAERQAKYRANLRGEVTKSDATVTGDSDASLDGGAPPKDNNSNPPDTSLRSDAVSARRAAWLRFKEAYPKKTGHSWQPAEERFYRWIKSGVDPEVMISGAEAYAKSRLLEDPKFTKAPLQFLKHECWKDDYEPTLFRPASGARASPQNSSSKRNGFFLAMELDRTH